MGLLNPTEYLPQVNEEILSSLFRKEALYSDFDYRTSLTYSKYVESLHLPEPDSNKSDCLEMEEDDELLKALDHHSIVTAQLPETADDHLQTADEIIEELDRMMVADEVEPALDLAFGDSQPCDDYRSAYVWKPVAVLNQMSIRELNCLVDDIDVCIRYHSACLVQELAAREDLDYEQELKDTFFTRLHEVHSRIEAFCYHSSPHSRSRSLSPLSQTASVCDKPETTKKINIFSGVNSAATAKSVLMNAALAVQRSWRRMGRSIENATSRSSGSAATNSRRSMGLIKRTSSAVSYHLRRITTPVRSEEVDAAAKKIIASNSNIDLPCLYETHDSDWLDSRSPFIVGKGRRGGESFSASSTPTSVHSPRRMIWSQSSFLPSVTAQLHTPEEDMKFLSTKIPFHQSTTGEGPTIGHLELFNEFLLCMLTSNPNLTPLLTDYILNVYAPGEKSMPKLVI